MVRTLKPYHMQKNLFELFAFTGGGDVKTLGSSAATQEQPLWKFDKILFLFVICFRCGKI